MTDETTPTLPKGPAQDDAVREPIGVMAAAAESGPGSTTVLANPEEELDATDAEAYAQLKAKRAERRRKKLIRRGIVAGVIVALGAGGFIAVNALNQQQTEMTYEPITDIAFAGSYIDAVDASGSLEPLSSTVITPTVDGTIAEVRVAAGQYVNEGDVLMVIDNPDLDLAIKEAQRNLDAAKESLASAKRSRDDAYKAAEQARAAQAAQPAAASAGISLLDDGGAGDAGSAGDTGGGAFDLPAGDTGIDTQAADDAVKAAERSVESAQAAVDQAVAKAAERTVTSPLSGNVVAMNAQVGASALGSGSGSDSGAGGLMQIADLSKMKVTIQVSEKDIARVAAGQAATVTFPAFPDISLSGTVQNIASIATGSGGGTYMDGSSVTFAVDVLISEPDPRLKPGMTASVNLITEQLDNVVMVPTMALQTDDGASYYVMVETDPETHASERRDVTVVTQNSDWAVVGSAEGADVNEPDGASMLASPLADGDVIVISGGMGDMMGADTAVSAS